MYVCICKGITEEQIRTAAKQGGSDREILNRLGVGTDCGVCLLSAVSSISNEKPIKTKTKKTNK